MLACTRYRSTETLEPTFYGVRVRVHQENTMKKLKRPPTSHDDLDDWVPNQITHEDDGFNSYPTVKREQLLEMYVYPKSACWMCQVCMGNGAGKGPNIRNKNITDLLELFNTASGCLSVEELAKLVFDKYIELKIHEQEIEAGEIRDVWTYEIAVSHMRDHLDNDQIVLSDAISKCSMHIRVIEECMYNITPAGEIQPNKAHHKIYVDLLKTRLEHIKQKQATRRNGAV